VEPFDERNIHQGAYELTLSRQVLTTPDVEGNKTQPGLGPALVIPPGQFGLLYTNERVTIPSDVLSFISIKARVKLKGLVNISGFHVDPGFSGRLKFSVYNAGNHEIYLEYDKAYFLIWFADLDQTTRDPYSGTHNGQTGINETDREQMSEGSQSPAALDNCAVTSSLGCVSSEGGLLRNHCEVSNFKIDSHFMPHFVSQN
jgi:dCTP deaminase